MLGNKQTAAPTYEATPTPSQSSFQSSSFDFITKKRPKKARAAAPPNRRAEAASHENASMRAAPSIASMTFGSEFLCPDLVVVVVLDFIPMHLHSDRSGNRESTEASLLRTMR